MSIAETIESTSLSAPYNPVPLSDAFNALSYMCPDFEPSAASLFAVCSEPEMRPDGLLLQLQSSLKASFDKIRLLRFRDLESSRASKRLAAARRECCRLADGGARVLVLIVGLPASDEADVRKQANAIRGLCLSGCKVVLSLYPEAEQLLDDLPEAVVFRCGELVLGGPSAGVDGGGQADEKLLGIFAASRGIPVLVNALHRSEEPDFTHIEFDSRYKGAVRDLIEGTLRPTLLSEEVRIRACMLLLGSGSIADLEDMGLRHARESLAALGANSLLYGINALDGTFSTIILRGDESLLSGIPIILSRAFGIDEVGAADPYGSHGLADGDLVTEACRVLCRRGEFFRAARILSFAGAPVFRSVAAEWPYEISNVVSPGRLALVAGEGKDGRGARLGLMSHCLSSRWDVIEKDICGLSAIDSAGPGDPIASVASVRAVCAGLSPRDDLALGGFLAIHWPPRDSMGAAVVGESPNPGVWLQALELDALLDGKMGEAYGLALASRPDVAEAPSTAACAAWLGLGICSSLLGDELTPEDSKSFRAAASFAEEQGLRTLSLAFAATPRILGVLLGGEGGSQEIEKLDRVCEARGDSAIHAVLLLVLAIADVRDGARVRGLVRLRQSRELSRAMGRDYLAVAAALLELGVRHLTGDLPREEEIASEVPAGSVWKGVGLVVSRAMSDPDVYEVGQMGVCPQECLWVLLSLARDMGVLSVRVREAMPVEWDSQLRRVEERGMRSGLSVRLPGHPERKKASRVPASAPTPVPAAFARVPVRLEVLGGFRLLVNGKLVSPGSLERRRSAPMLAYLAAVPGHQVKRFMLVESVWPSYTYGEGRQRAYEATSVIRKELTRVADGVPIDPISVNRAQRTLGLRSDVIECDLDEFEALAKDLVASRGHTEELLAIAELVDTKYKGDLYVPWPDGQGVVEARRIEVRSLCADAMVVASRLARGVGRDALAVRYARRACLLDPLREDAELELLRSLELAGRGADAERSFDEFSARLVSQEGRPPARALREAAGRTGSPRPKGGPGHKETSATLSIGKRDENGFLANETRRPE